MRVNYIHQAHLLIMGRILICLVASTIYILTVLTLDQFQESLIEIEGLDEISFDDLENVDIDQ